jgi:hypothetical protein
MNMNFCAHVQDDNTIVSVPSKEEKLQVLLKRHLKLQAKAAAITKVSSFGGDIWEVH